MKHKTRPRIEGDREAEILDATVSMLIDVGYERLTMDAVAKAAKASKATLYRRWESKASLVIDALLRAKGSRAAPTPVDTGSLRDDLITTFCGGHGLGNNPGTWVVAAVLTTLQTDAEFAAEFRERFVRPKSEAAKEIYRRAIDRGEIPADTDVELIAPALSGILLHRLFLLGQPITDEQVVRVIDTLILPAVQHPSTL